MTSRKNDNNNHFHHVIHNGLLSHFHFFPVSSFLFMDLKFALQTKDELQKKIIIIMIQTSDFFQSYVSVIGYDDDD